MNTTIYRTDLNEFSLLGALAGSLGASIVLFDREDRLLFASDDYKRFVPLPDDVFTPGIRLRDFLGAVFDTGRRFGVPAARVGEISRDDWIADQIAIHWRERHESIEQLDDGHWIKLGKRRLPGGMLITFIADISDQKRRDLDFAEMRDQAELAQHILDKLPNPVIVKDAKLRYALVNNAFCELLGIPARDIIGMRAAELVGPAAGAEFEESERQVLKTGAPIEFVEDIPNTDGTVSRAITRKHRSGVPGAYYVTISVNKIINFTTDRGLTPNDVPGVGKPAIRKRVLVVDENTSRAQTRVAALISCGTDALALADQHQVIAFLETAKSMGIAIDGIEASPFIRSALLANPSSKNHPVLTSVLSDSNVDQITATGCNCKLEFNAGSASEQKRTAPPLNIPTEIQDREIRKSADVVRLKVVGAPVGAGQSSNIESALDSGKTEKSAPGSSARIRILVAEDNSVNQIVFQQILDGFNIDCEIVNNGQEAVAAWRGSKPDLILMDISMPIMNGHQATRAIREEENRDGPAVNHVPIIAITAHALAGDSDECFAAGMDDYLTKPISPEKLRSMITKWSSLAVSKKIGAGL